MYIKKKNFDGVLSSEELSELKGGEQEVKNKNTTPTCICYYNDSPSLTNENTVADCSCYCIELK